MFILIVILFSLANFLASSNTHLHIKRKAFEECRFSEIGSLDNSAKLKLKSENNIIFRHSTYDDFSKGLVSNSGQNLYVSKDGEIRFINWFDFNNDGYPEIVFVNDHNPFETSDGFIYYNHPVKGFRSLMPPKHQFVPGFQQLEWMDESLKHIDRLPSLGGGSTLVDDLNDDGYLDIVFANFVHGWSSNHFPITIYWGSENGFDKSRVSYLPSLSASGFASSDLDGNGYKDIVVANVGREAYASINAGNRKNKKRVVGKEENTSYIYWQDIQGYSVENRTELPTEYALDVAISDLNQDGYSDIVFLQGGVPGSIRIFYGTKQGINVNKFTDIKVKAPIWDGNNGVRRLLVADLNGDKKPDIFVPSHGDISEIFWNGSDGFNELNRTDIPTRDAVAAETEDLNGNGLNDLIIVNKNGPSYVYWNAPDGFNENRRTELPTNIALGVAVSDLNKDGFFDIVFANSQKGESYDNPSFIYWGSKDGYDPAVRDELWGFGPVDVAVGDFDKNGLDDIFLMNRQSGKRSPQYASGAYNPIDLFIYWGNKSSKYSDSSTTLLPGARTQSSVVATDLTGNGYADLIYLTNDGSVLNIFYGDQTGFSVDRSKQYDIKIQGRTPQAADLNKDGFLDIIIESQNNELAVLYGNKSGFEEVQLYVFDNFKEKFRTQAIGDVNNDGNLDLVFGSHGFIAILYGEDDGTFDIHKLETIKTDMYTTKISLADFNGDGFLDIFGHHHTPAHRGGEYSVYSAIYWNNNGLFSKKRRLELPSHGAHTGSVADVNKDGYPDILIANYNAQQTRNLETFIYWGGRNGNYSYDNVTRLPSYSPIANLVLDLNGDGINDIVVYNHSKSNRYATSSPIGGMHSIQSFIYWGTEKGWSYKNRDEISAFGPHGRLAAEPGNIMNRQSFEEYTSNVIATDGFDGQYNLKVESNHNFRQHVKVFIKSAGDINSLEQAEWKEIKLKERNDRYFLYTGSISKEDTLIKYKLRMFTGETGNGPVIRAVEMHKQN